MVEAADDEKETRWPKTTGKIIVGIAQCVRARTLVCNETDEIALNPLLCILNRIVRASMSPESTKRFRLLERTYNSRINMAFQERYMEKNIQCALAHTWRGHFQ